jgi:predicted Zn-dependent protease with MMP-like domain
MFQVSQKRFEDFIAAALDALPERYQKHLNNVVIVAEDDPSPEQRVKLHLHDGMTLFGLYEGIPLTQRGNGYSMVLPDKITIFKNPSEASAQSEHQLIEQVRHTVWHEVAHYYGLDHIDIHAREQ